MIVPSYSVSTETYSPTTLPQQPFPLGQLPSRLTSVVATYFSSRERIQLSKTNHSWRAWCRPLTPHRLPSVLLGKIATYLPASDFLSLSTTNHKWEALKNRLVWLALIQRDFPFENKELHSGYPGAIKTGRLCALIYRGLRTMGSYFLQTTLTHPGSGAVYSADFDREGSRIVTVPAGVTALVYTRQFDGNWIVTDTLKGSHDRVFSAAFDRTGRLIVTASRDGTACVYAKQSNERWVLIDTLIGHHGSVINAAFDRTGNLIVTAFSDSAVCVYARQSNGRWVLNDTLTGHHRFVYSAVFNRTGNLIVTASRDGTACVYAKQFDGHWVLIDILGGDKPVLSAAFDRTGRLIVTASDDGITRVYAWQTHGRWVLIDTLDDHYGRVYSAIFDRKGRLIVTASHDGTACVYTRQFNERWVLTDTLTGYNGPVTSAAFDPTGSHIVTTSEDGMVRIWERNLAKIIRRAFERMEIQNAGIRTSYQATPKVLIRYTTGFLTPAEQQAHRLVNRISAQAYRCRFASFRLPSTRPFNTLTQNPAIQINRFLRPHERQTLCLVNTQLARHLGHQTLLDKLDKQRREFCIKVTDGDLAGIMTLTLLFSRMLADQR